jgi:hypothetical protein
MLSDFVFKCYTEFYQIGEFVNCESRKSPAQTARFIEAVDLFGCLDYRSYIQL